MERKTIEVVHWFIWEQRQRMEQEFKWTFLKGFDDNSNSTGWSSEAINLLHLMSLKSLTHELCMCLRILIIITEEEVRVSTPNWQSLIGPVINIINPLAVVKHNKLRKRRQLASHQESGRPCSDIPPVCVSTLGTRDEVQPPPAATASKHQTAHEGLLNLQRGTNWLY